MIHNFLALAALMCLAPGQTAPPATNDEVVVATVGDDVIRAGEVERLLAKFARGKRLNPEVVPRIRSRLLEEIISRRLVLAYARRVGEAATAAELTAERDKLTLRLAAQNRSLADFMKSQSIGETDLERQLAWNVVWKKYLARYVTKDRCEAYFAAHRRDLDGTEMAVGHILLRRPAAGGEAAAERPEKRAETIRREIASGGLSFAEAARKYSAGPSAEDGGRLGWIGRHGPMDESFSRAALALNIGEVSRPVKTVFGIHLIRCDEIRPGSKRLSDVRREVEDALARELLDKLAETERRYTPVKYTGAIPHFKNTGL